MVNTPKKVAETIRRIQPFVIISLIKTTLCPFVCQFLPFIYAKLSTSVFNFYHTLSVEWNIARGSMWMRCDFYSLQIKLKLIHLTSVNHGVKTGIISSPCLSSLRISEKLFIPLMLLNQSIALSENLLKLVSYFLMIRLL